LALAITVNILPRYSLSELFVHNAQCSAIISYAVCMNVKVT